MRRTALLLFVGTVAFGAVACTSAGYRPLSVHSDSGYAETRLGENGWRVEYVGADADSREAVERYMQRRAAELTLQAGYDWFAPVQSDVSEQSEIVVEAAPPPPVSSGEAVWRPRWRRHGMLGWTDWDPRGVAPREQAPGPEAQSRVVNRYAATADFTMGRGAPPANGFDARSIIARPPS